ncbi:disease resistance protein RGA2-like [Pistacia vera]|uniref:disease resistance protein RGA2-like n=1 Tax=Pistacia vera TaxID=55513 RepID=UPI0012632317|nr:disease resistance protein RGA2-like [Pistacia vera]
MAEALVSTILRQLASLAAEEVKLLACADKAVGKLTSNFQAIQAVLEDAESRQMKEKRVGDWLNKLKDVSYDIEDVLDEWITASRKLQMKEAENASKLWKKALPDQILQTPTLQQLEIDCPSRKRYKETGDDRSRSLTFQKSLHEPCVPMRFRLVMEDLEPWCGVMLLQRLSLMGK